MAQKEYTPREAGVAILNHLRDKLRARNENPAESLEKAAPQNETSAQAAGLKVPQPPAPPAPQKLTPKAPKEFKLKKFLDTRNEKKLQKAGK